MRRPSVPTILNTFKQIREGFLSNPHRARQPIVVAALKHTNPFSQRGPVITNKTPTCAPNSIKTNYFCTHDMGRYRDFTHKHDCKWCGKCYKHEHHFFKEDHRQFEYQCANPDCSQFYGKGDHRHRKNPTLSKLCEYKTSDSKSRSERSKSERSKSERSKSERSKSERSKSERSEHEAGEYKSRDLKSKADVREKSRSERSRYDRLRAERSKPERDRSRGERNG